MIGEIIPESCIHLCEEPLFYPKDDFLKRWTTHGSRFTGNHRPFVPVSLYHVDYLFHRISIRLLIRIQVLRKPSDLLPAWDVADSITASDVERLLSALQINVETYREEKYMRYQFLREHVERFFTRSIQQHLDLVDRGGSATEDQLTAIPVAASVQSLSTTSLVLFSQIPLLRWRPELAHPRSISGLRRIFDLRHFSTVSISSAQTLRNRTSSRLSPRSVMPVFRRLRN